MPSRRGELSFPFFFLYSGFRDIEKWTNDIIEEKESISLSICESLMHETNIQYLLMKIYSEGGNLVYGMVSFCNDLEIEEVFNPILIKRGMPVSEVRNDLILFIKFLSNNSKINYWSTCYKDWGRVSIWKLDNQRIGYVKPNPCPYIRNYLPKLQLLFNALMHGTRNLIIWANSRKMCMHTSRIRYPSC